MTLAATDRRIHQIFVTRNTEYHLRRDRCVAIRDRHTGDWRDDPRALFRRVSAAVTLLENGSLMVRESLPHEGESLLFEGENGALTSPVLCIERPSFSLAVCYPGPGAAGHVSHRRAG